MASDVLCSCFGSFMGNQAERWGHCDSGMLHQIWHLQSEAQREVDLALKDLRRLKGPTVAFHVRGDDSSGDEELLFDVRDLLSMVLSYDCALCTPRQSHATSKDKHEMRS